jgi:hypothetical protein
LATEIAENGNLCHATHAIKEDRRLSVALHPWGVKKPFSTSFKRA